MICSLRAADFSLRVIPEIQPHLQRGPATARRDVLRGSDEQPIEEVQSRQRFAIRRVDRAKNQVCCPILGIAPTNFIKVADRIVLASQIPQNRSPVVTIVNDGRIQRDCSREVVVCQVILLEIYMSRPAHLVEAPRVVGASLNSETSIAQEHRNTELLQWHRFRLLAHQLLPTAQGFRISRRQQVGLLAFKRDVLDVPDGPEPRL